MEHTTSFGLPCPLFYFYFFFNDTATTEIYPLSLHDALPICMTCPCHKYTTIPSSVPQTALIRRATLISFNHTRMALVTSTRPVARPRVTTVEDCTPTLPDTALIIGAHETRAIICSRVALKCHRTAPTTNSPHIVTRSQGRRYRATLKGELV